MSSYLSESLFRYLQDAGVVPAHVPYSELASPAQLLPVTRSLQAILQTASPTNTTCSQPSAGPPNHPLWFQKIIHNWDYGQSTGSLFFNEPNPLLKNPARLVLQTSTVVPADSPAFVLIGHAAWVRVMYCSPQGPCPTCPPPDRLYYTAHKVQHTYCDNVAVFGVPDDWATRHFPDEDPGNDPEGLLRAGFIPRGLTHIIDPAFGLPNGIRRFSHVRQSGLPAVYAHAADGLGVCPLPVFLSKLAQMLKRDLLFDPSQVHEAVRPLWVKAHKHLQVVPYYRGGGETAGSFASP